MIGRSQKQGKIFVNTIPTANLTQNFLVTLGKYFTAKEERVPKQPLGPFRTDLNVYNTPPATGLRITWLGHSSLIIEIDGKRILTDPVWGRASFVQWAGPKRFFAAPMAVSDIPKLDAVIISHDHYDHLDATVIPQLAGRRVPFFCSLGVGQYLHKWGIDASLITEMDWTDAVSVGDVTITATPARHFSGRGLHNRNQTLWSSFVIRGPQHNIFFGADSGFFPGFAEIGEQFGPFDLTMLEIGASNPAWADIHMGPVKAVNAHLALKGKLMMPIHWGTFNLALHAWNEPVETLLKTAAKKGVALVLPAPGMPVDITASPYNSNWWKR